jgi:hypothetical protein
VANQGDDIERLTQILWAMHSRKQLFRELTGFDGAGMGRAAKATGCSIGQLQAMMSLETRPTRGEALAALSALYSTPSAELNGAAR